ncbi:MAG: transcription-repair coupling factor (superfamily II helicase) [Parcubacteria group bacterium Gr01-1014_70]|nr:MAG: transcription-repair coupling factor (superfamily II helicase) [Parcubacteria group bacterium Gr01-1014_70]
MYTRYVRDAQKREQLLIAGLHPQLLEKSAVWFEKQKREILRARLITPFWQHITTVVEPGMHTKLSEFLRQLYELGYARAQTVYHPGEYAAQGGEVTIYPINEKAAWRIAFLGNHIESIEQLDAAEQPQEYTGIQKEFLERNRLGLLKNGDFVVHADHGIGTFRGFKSSPQAGGTQYIVIEYAKPHADAPPDTLLVPEHLAKKVTPYVGFRIPRIHRLGTPLWNHIKNKAKEDIIKFAKELLETYAKREVAERSGYEPHADLEQSLALSFVYEETPDQTRAVSDVLTDMEAAVPMDRVILADVGFGKTEVAIRAAFRAVLNGRQTALLCPTTILADQHFETFKERFSTLPVSIARLSRLESPAAVSHAIQNLKQGKTDIVIGTHRLLSKDISFHNLGLLIVDEEQRFGVKQKEHIRALQSGVDVLTLSATPIPRTLHFALSGLRPMSVIATPPKNRIAPKTFVLPFGKRVIKNAIEAELARGGQIYVLCNRIGKMPMMRDFIQEMHPRARIAAIHGRMNEAELTRVMHQFRQGLLDILIATTIIENGLDISNANTLIVEDATRIGLAQAHQLRGRIGRGNVQSYAFFLYPSRALKEKAKQRLDALFQSQYLGAGQDIAYRDMEIRGAGNILGRDQSGRVNQIGLNLYCQMLAEAVEQLQRSSFLHKTQR